MDGQAGAWVDEWKVGWGKIGEVCRYSYVGSYAIE